MRLLSLVLTSVGFLFFALEVTKLISGLKHTTNQLTNQFNASNQALNTRSQRGS